MDVGFALLRHPAYCLDNLAFLVNIERWSIIIGHNRINLKGEKGLKYLRYYKTTAIVIGSIFVT